MLFYRNGGIEMFNINNKFEIGQEVYLIRKVKIKNPCPACNGEGNKIIDGNKFYCSKCNALCEYFFP